MMPLLFGSSERQLCGVYTPASGSIQRRGVVICPPLGQEYLRSFRACRVLASRLAEKGCDVLRFDYFGTGNSGGEFEELSMAGAVEDTVSAITEIQDLAGVRQVTAVGLRAGALIAALATPHSEAVDKLVLWDPVADGMTYLKEEIEVGEPYRASGGREAQGFLFTEAIQRELGRLSMTDVDGWPADVLIVASEEKLEHRNLERRIGDLGVTVESQFFDAPPSWTQLASLGVGAVPAAALGHIAAW